jgi:uncharacterized C2H2 Zn-finger protein
MLNPGPQAGAPASEGAARVGGEPPSFQYPHCDRVLTTASGRGLHVRRAHLANNPMLNPGPQAEAPANEGAARVGGEPPSFQCPHCDRVLTTASGRGLHVRRAHLAEFNNAINIERVHAQWSLEEKFDGDA